MNPTGRFLDGFARATSDGGEMTIESDNGDGTYNARTVDTRALERISRGFVTDTFAVGSRVLVQRPSGARNVIGALPVIISRAPQEQRGVSGSRPEDVRETTSAPTVTSIEPDPLILQAGGAAQEHVIRGFGFTAAATYDGVEGGEDPTITNATPPVITPRSVTMHVQAASASPLGDFDLVIAGVRIPNAVRVMKKRRPVPSIWALAYLPDLESMELIRIDPSDLSHYSTHALPEPLASDVVVDPNSVVFVKTLTKVLRVNRASGVQLDVLEAGETDETVDHAFVAGSNLLFAHHDFDVRLTTVHTRSLASATRVLDASPLSGGNSACVAADSQFIFVRVGNGSLFKLSASTFAVMDEVFIPCVGGGSTVAVNANALFVLRYGDDVEIAKVSRGSLLVTDSVAFPTNEVASDEPPQLRTSGGFVYGTLRQYAFRLNASTMEATFLDASPRHLAGCVVIKGKLYAGDADGGINVCDFVEETIERTQYDYADVVRVAFG